MVQVTVYWCVNVGFCIRVCECVSMREDTYKTGTQGCDFGHHVAVISRKG